MRLICGIDEAGRGPVLGSMFIGGVAVREDQLDALDELGLKDSKKLSDRRRRDLGEQVTDLVESFHVTEVTADEIDELREIMSLNQIELKAFATTIQELTPAQAFIDLPEPDSERFQHKIRDELGERFSDLEIVAEHGADETYPVVSAASILAKNAREDHVNELQEQYGQDLGSGYPHDTPTITFLEDYLEEHGELPAAARASWNTAQRLMKEQEQQGLEDF